MSKHIQRVSENIDQFVDAFAKNNPLEYHLAVVSVYDSRRFHSNEYQSLFGKTEAYKLPGQFRQVKKSETEVIADKYFISSDDVELKNQLKHTLKVGVQDLESGGPLTEEVFSPVAAIYNFLPDYLEPKFFNKNDKTSYAAQADAIQTAAKKKFFMGKDSYKILFFVTDASDATDLSASELHKFMVAQSGGDESKVLAFGAIIPSELTNPVYPDGKVCARDNMGKPYKLEELLRLTKKVSEASNIVSLCSNFGSQFAEFGKSIRERVTSVKIPLTQSVPVINDNPEETLSVTYGMPGAPKAEHQLIPFENAPGIIGFKYDPQSNSIRINSKFDFAHISGAKIFIHYTAISPTNLRTNKVDRYGEGQ
jgi:hypothetical protein